MNNSPNIIPWVFIFDGDNTLWDTNAVFTRAQIAALKELRDGRSRHASLERDFMTLRSIDDRLVSLHGKYEYDFGALFLALDLLFDGCSEMESVRYATKSMAKRVRGKTRDRIERAQRAFHEKLAATPPLFDGVKATLKRLRRRPSVIFLVSEGNRSRIYRVIQALGLRRYFDGFYGGTKTVNLYRRILGRGVASLSRTDRRHVRIMVVGDLLDRDIRVGNKIGAITVLRIGGYRPNQRPRDKLEQPNYRIREIPEILQTIKVEERRRRKNARTSRSS